jgi:hypothetical protein
MSHQLFSQDTPLMFADATAEFEKLGKQYIRHKKGFFIMAPSGSGKTHFVKNQTEPHWVDGDDLWVITKAHPAGDWWNDGVEAITIIDQRCDVMTAQAKRMGFWVVGASNSWLKPDAIVLPHWSTHKRYIRLREEGNYDGGATSAQLGGVLGHRKWIAKWAHAGVPKFGSVAEAAAYLAKTI